MAYPNWNIFRTVPPRFDFGVVFDDSSEYDNINFDDDIPIYKNGNRSSEYVRLYQVPDINKRKKASDVLSTILL